MPKHTYNHGRGKNESITFATDTEVSADSSRDIKRKTNRDDITVLVDDGVYEMDRLRVKSSGNVVLKAKNEGKAVLKVPANYQGYLLDARCQNVVFDGFVIDVTAPNCMVRNNLIVDNAFAFVNVDLKGSMTLNRGEDVVRPFVYPRLLAYDSLGIINFRAPTLDHYGSYAKGDRGTWGIRSGPENKGTLEVLDTVIKWSSSHGMYISASNGAVNVRGGDISNNNGVNIRVPSDSVVENVRSVHDDRERPDTVDKSKWFVGGMPIFYETKARDGTGKGPLNGGEVRNCEVGMRSWEAGFRGAILAAKSHGSLDVIDTAIDIDVDDVKAAIRAYSPPGVWLLSGSEGRTNHHSYGDPPKPWDITVDGCTFEGDNQDYSAVEAHDRPGSEVRASALNGHRVRGAKIADGGEKRMETTTVPDDMVVFRINGRGIDRRFAYEFAVRNGVIRPWKEANMNDDTDYVEDQSAGGVVNRGEDSWLMSKSADIVHADISSALDVTLDGQEVPLNYRDGLLVIDGTKGDSGGSKYTIGFPNGSNPTKTDEQGASISDYDEVTEQDGSPIARGSVGAGIDAYRFDLRKGTPQVILETPGVAVTTLNGQVIGTNRGVPDTPSRKEVESALKDAGIDPDKSLSAVDVAGRVLGLSGSGWDE